MWRSWKIQLITFSSKFNIRMKGVAMTCRQYLYPSVPDRARVLCEEQLLFVLGRNLFGKLRYIMRMCLCALIWLSAHDSPSTPDGSVLTHNYATQCNKRKRSKPRRSSPDHLHCWSSLSFLCVSEPEMTLPRPALGSQLHRVYWRNGSHASARPEQSLFVCSVYQSVTACVYMHGSSRPPRPRCPGSPRRCHIPAPPLYCTGERNAREQSSSLSTPPIMSLQERGCAYWSWVLISSFNQQAYTSILKCLQRWWKSSLCQKTH